MRCLPSQNHVYLNKVDLPDLKDDHYSLPTWQASHKKTREKVGEYTVDVLRFMMSASN